MVIAPRKKVGFTPLAKKDPIAPSRSKQFVPLKRKAVELSADVMKDLPKKVGTTVAKVPKRGRR